MLKQILDVLNVVWRYLILLALAVGVYYVFNRIVSCNRVPAIVAEQHAGIAVDDSLAALQIIRADNHKLRDNLNSVTSRLKEALGLIVRPLPTGYSSRTDPMPFDYKPIVIVVDSSDKTKPTVEKYRVPSIDIPVMLVANSEVVRMHTKNPYLSLSKQRFAKIYEWKRLRKDFGFGLRETVNPNKLDGVYMEFTTRKFEWNGFAALIGLAFPQGPYGGVDAKMTFWEFFELSPRAVIYPNFPSSTTFAVEARLRF